MERVDNHGPTMCAAGAARAWAAATYAAVLWRAAPRAPGGVGALALFHPAQRKKKDKDAAGAVCRDVMTDGRGSPSRLGAAKSIRNKP